MGSTQRERILRKLNRVPDRWGAGSIPAPATR